MRQFLLATALIALPVAATLGAMTAALAQSSGGIYAARAAVSTNAPAPGLGDLAQFTSIIADVQARAAKGDLEAAKTRIKGFEIAWDANEKGLKPIDPAHWGLIDEAADGAFTAIRSGTPDPVRVTETLAA